MYLKLGAKPVLLGALILFLSIGCSLGETGRAPSPGEATPRTPSLPTPTPIPLPTMGEEGFALPGDDGIAVGPDGSAYVVNFSNSIVSHYTASGEKLEYWDWEDYVGARGYVDIYHYVGSKGQDIWRLTGDSAETQFIISVAVAQDGRFYVLSETGQVFRFTASGSFIEACGGQGDTPGKFRMPEDIAVAPDGTVYIADSGNERVQYFTATGDFIGLWGDSGTEPGQLQAAAGIDVASDGSVYVADYVGIHHFTADGTFIERWGGYLDNPWDFGWAQDVAVGSDGTVYVADAHGSIQRFTSNGEFFRSWQLSEKEPGQISLPMSIAVAPDGTVYVHCRYSSGWSGVQHFTADGELLKVWW